MMTLRNATLITLTTLLSACGGGSEENTTPATPLFDSSWFSFNTQVSTNISNGNKTYNYNIYRDSINIDNSQVLSYLHENVVGSLLGTSTLLNQTGVTNLLYNPYAGLDSEHTLTEKKLFISQSIYANEPVKTYILTGETANSISFVPYNSDLYKDSAAVTIQYTKIRLDGILLSDAIDTGIIDIDDPSLIKLKNSGLKFPVDSIGLKQTAFTNHEDSLFFSSTQSLPYLSISDWKASRSTGAVFKDMQWSGISFSCLVDNNNVPTSSCVVNYDNKVYDADYTLKGTSNEQYYFLFNKTAADALSAGIKQYFINPTVIQTAL